MALLYALMPCTTAITSKGVLRMIYLSGSSSGSRGRSHPWMGEDLCKRGHTSGEGQKITDVGHRRETWTTLIPQACCLGALRCAGGASRCS